MSSPSPPLAASPFSSDQPPSTHRRGPLDLLTSFTSNSSSSALALAASYIPGVSTAANAANIASSHASRYIPRPRIVRRPASSPNLHQQVVKEDAAVGTGTWSTGMSRLPSVDEQSSGAGSGQGHGRSRSMAVIGPAADVHGSPAATSRTDRQSQVLALQLSSTSAPPFESNLSYTILASNPTQMSSPLPQPVGLSHRKLAMARRMLDEAEREEEEVDRAYRSQLLAAERQRQQQQQQQQGRWGVRSGPSWLGRGGSVNGAVVGAGAQENVVATGQGSGEGGSDDHGAYIGEPSFCKSVSPTCFGFLGRGIDRW